MPDQGRGPISSVVGGVEVVNSYYSGNLTRMSEEQLRARLARLLEADPLDEDEDEAFENRQAEISAVQAELGRRS